MIGLVTPRRQGAMEEREGEMWRRDAIRKGEDRAWAPRHHALGAATPREADWGCVQK